MSTPTGPSPPPLIFIFDQLRTRSHLFHRFFSTHPSLTPLWHPYIKSAFLGPERHTQYARNSIARYKEVMEDMAPLYGADTYASCGEELSAAVANLKSKHPDQSLLVNEHTLNILKQDLMFALSRNEAIPSPLPVNPTVLPDSLYTSLTPILLIRNPLHQLRSSYTAACKTSTMRPGDEDFHHTTTLTFSRFLYDHFASRGRTPIVVDGEDVLWRTREVAEGVCGRLGLDAGQVKDEWEVIAEGSYGSNEAVVRAYMAEVLASTGVKREGVDPGEPEMDVEVAKWKDQFGKEVALQLKAMAERIMPDYEYLRQFKV